MITRLLKWKGAKAKAMFEPGQPHQAWLSLGGNLGNRFENIVGGAKYLLQHGFSFVNCSGIYETEPAGYADQPRFFNLVLHLATSLDPPGALKLCQQAEKTYGRERPFRWGPRTLDVDILLYDDLTLDLPDLTIPHPRLAERAFVLGPLEDMDPGILDKWGLPSLRGGIVLLIPDADVKIELTGAVS